MSGDSYGWRAKVYDRVLEPMNAPLRSVASGLVTVPSGAVVVDIGCGTGAALAEYQRAGCQVRGTDTSAAMLEQARLRLGEGADLRETRGASVPFEDGSADLVLLSFVLHSLSPEDAAALLDEAARILTPDGHVLVTEFGVTHLRFPRGFGMRAVTALAEIAAGPTHARNSLRFLRRGGTQTLLGASWAVEQIKHVAGGNITITVLART